MTNEEINILLNKYWNCETTISEEQELQKYFSQNNVSEEFQPYKSLFTYTENLQAATLSDDFDAKLQKAIREDKKYITIRIFAPMLKIAASIVLILGLAISILFITKETNKPQFANNLEENETAIEQATYALRKVSNALQATQEASMQTLQDIDNLGLDWSEIDSLSLEAFSDNTENNDLESVL